MNILENFITQDFSDSRFIAFLETTFGAFEKVNIDLCESSDIFTRITRLTNNPIILSDHKKLYCYIFHTKKPSITNKVALHSELKRVFRQDANLCDCVLACFVPPDSHKSREFRFSLMTIDFDLETNKDTFSNLKRHSFVLGANIPHNTAQNALTRLASFAPKITLNNLCEAFELEPLTKAFFEDYKKQFSRVVKALDKIANALNGYNGINDSTLAREAFAKKLLGRLVFLYFLQKKGWLGVKKDAKWGDGDKDFLKHIFEKAQTNSKNFYESYLCPLFFDSLNTPRDGDYSDTFKCKIPFLNGGLFERDFSDKKAESLIANALTNDIFEDIFDFFGKYNFTIEESTSNDSEISIDPEMLGKIFENLLGENLRKDSGSFYTPREVVSFMCKNALLNALLSHFPNHKSDLKAFIFSHKSDLPFIVENGANLKSAILSLKILDPSIGSGAFPMGLLQEIITALETLDKTMDSPKKAQLKREIIQNQIYGIDIEADAIDIARLRFWLSIAVDEENPQPLPNLDFKFMQGNSLISRLKNIEIIPSDNSDNSVDLEGNRDSNSSIFDLKTANELTALFSSYFTQTTRESKDNLKDKILKIMDSAFNARIAQIDSFITSEKQNPKVSPKDIAKQQEKILQYEDFKDSLNHLLRDYKQNNFHSDKLFLYGFFFAEVFCKKDSPSLAEGVQGVGKIPHLSGFDIVIGNPPYGAKISDNDKKHLKSTYKHATQGSLDTYKLFIERGFYLLKKSGVLSYIVPLSVTSSKSNIALHKLLLDNCEVIKVSGYGDRPAKIFTHAEQKCAIIEFTRTNTKCQALLTSKVNKRYSSQSIQEAMDKIKFIDSLEFYQEGAFCKIDSQIEVDIMRKIYGQKQSVKDFIDSSGNPIYYRSSGNRYYNLFTTFSTESSKEKAFLIKSKFTKAISAILSSNLYFWFRNAYSNNRDSYIYEFERFKLPKISEKVWQKLEKLGAEFEADIEAKANFTSTGTKEYRLRKSKHLIDQIDRLICPLYNLTHEEMDFIINYEVEFRTDQDK